MSFKTYHPAFHALLGENPSIELLLEKNYAFAHEAGVFIADTDELIITSNRLVSSNGQQRVQISQIKLDTPTSNLVHKEIECDDIVMANGAVNYQQGILFCAQGSMSSPSGLYSVSAVAPFNAKLVISEFYGRPFNSVNDVVVHSDGSIWFTDPPYGYEQGYRPKPLLPSQVYRFQPSDGSIRAMADGFGHPNGICFSPDEKIVYVTDTDCVCGDGSVDYTKASSIYAFDVQIYSKQPFLTNRRLFAMCDTGIPDGIKCDMDGNVYSGCGDGVNIWSPGGCLIGKILLDGGVANFCFGRRGEMFLLNETKLWRATLADSVRGALLKI